MKIPRKLLKQGNLKRAVRQVFPLIVLMINHSGLEAQKSSGLSWSSNHCLASFMTEGASSGSFRHFVVLPNGQVESFAPGENPKIFTGIDKVTALSAGTFHILALKSDGTVWAWGRNDDKQLGNEALMKNNSNSNVPVQVTGIRNAVAISAVGSNSYALLSDGTVWAWGYGNNGMIGDGGKITGANISSNWSARGRPVQVKGITQAVALSGPMALLQDGTVWMWGFGYWGQLGNGADTSSALPVRVKGISHAVAIAYRGDGALALLSDGTVWSWGRNSKGQLGNGVFDVGGKEHSNIPLKITGLSDVKEIDAGSVCLALLKDGTVRAWGWGAVGGMGTGRPGTHDVNPSPLKVPGVDHVIAVKSGNGFGIALKDDGILIGWGANMMATGLYHQSWKPIIIGHIKL